MDEKTKALFEMFEIGIENERSAQEFYENLIQKSTSEIERQIFGHFLEEEKKHEQKLMEAYADMKERYGFK